MTTMREADRHATTTISEIDTLVCVLADAKPADIVAAWRTALAQSRDYAVQAGQRAIWVDIEKMLRRIITRERIALRAS